MIAGGNVLAGQHDVAETGGVGADFAPEDINCSGCRTPGVKGGYTGACPLRACALRRETPTCGDCGDFGDCSHRREFEAQSGLDMGSLFTPKERP